MTAKLSGTPSKFLEGLMKPRSLSKERLQGVDRLPPIAASITERPLGNQAEPSFTITRPQNKQYKNMTPFRRVGGNVLLAPRPLLKGVTSTHTRNESITQNERGGVTSTTRALAEPFRPRMKRSLNSLPRMNHFSPEKTSKTGMTTGESVMRSMKALRSSSEMATNSLQFLGSRGNQDSPPRYVMKMDYSQLVLTPSTGTDTRNEHIQHVKNGLKYVKLCLKEPSTELILSKTIHVQPLHKSNHPSNHRHVSSCVGKMKTLVLDIDETLIHCPPENAASIAEVYNSVAKLPHSRCVDWLRRETLSR
jgi:hypothetical protein